MVESSFRPVCAKSGSLASIKRSVSERSVDGRLVINAKTMWLYGGILSVKQTAGRIFVEDKSSKGNGRRTILYFIRHGLSVIKSIYIVFLA